MSTSTLNRRPGYGGTCIRQMAAFFVVMNLLTLAYGTHPAYAGIATSGDVRPVYDGSNPWSLTNSVYVGWRDNDGTLEITDAVVDSTRNIYIGSSVRHSGSVSVSGYGAQLNGNYLFLGYGGPGTLRIEDGGVVNVDSDLFAGYSHEANGAIHFQGGELNTSSLYASPDDLLGTGHINTKGLVSDIDLVFDASRGLQQQFIFNSLPDQNVTLDLDLSDPNTSRALGVGYRGNATLTVKDGVGVASIYGILGHHSGSKGTADVYGSGSRLELNHLVVGGEGEGSLHVRSGGTINSGLSRIASYSGSEGSVVVSGADTRWESYSMSVGTEGSGELLVRQGGVVTSAYGFIARALGSAGKVTVTDPGSQWIQSVELTVGGEGAGQMIIKHGGVVTSERGARLGNWPDVESDVTVTGNGSKWSNNDTLHVGYYGVGELSIFAGGEVTTDSLHIGSRRGYPPRRTVAAVTAGEEVVLPHSVGAVNISGDDSIIEVNDQLQLGYFGEALFRHNGGTVRVGSGGILFASQPEGRGYYNLNHGTLDLQGNGIQVGDGTDYDFRFNGGRLLDAGTIDYKKVFEQDGGVLSPGGSIGQTEIVSGYALNAGTVEIELGGVGNTHDVVTSGGDIDIALTGTTLNLLGIGAIDAGTYTVIESTGGALSGMFEHVTGIGLHPGLVDVAYTPTAVTVTLNASYLPGDLDGDGLVGLGDLDIVLAHWNQTVTPGDLLSGDSSSDGFIGLDDLDMLLQNWNTGTPPGDATGNAVPEPGTGLLIGLGAMWGWRSRRVS